LGGLNNPNLESSVNDPIININWHRLLE